MMRDVRLRKVDCIVVKDLSRFGRNHIETGNYIEKIFPFMGVRFIAVTDSFDSMNLSGQNDVMDVNLKNLVNEMYARDIAVKVRASRRVKREQGSYMGGIPPYGYKVGQIGDKRCLFVEENTADIVRKIFELFLSGKNMKEIIVWLYENKVVRPTVYQKTGQVYCQEEGELEQWSKETVKMMLKNPIYIGCLVQERICGKDYRICKRHDIDAGNWPVIKHAHEAVICERLFWEAAEKFEELSRHYNKGGISKVSSMEEDIFTGVLYCGECGAKMKRISSARELGTENKIRSYSYKCPNSGRIDRFKCAGKSITLPSLTDVVKKIVRLEFVLSGIRPKDLVEMNNREADAFKKKRAARLAMLDRKLKGITELGSEQYLKYRMGEIDEVRFKREKEENDKKTAIIHNECRDIAEKIRAMESETVRKGCFFHTLMKGSGDCELTSEIVRTLIKKIEVYPEHRIKVTFNFERSGNKR